MHMGPQKESSKLSGGVAPHDQSISSIQAPLIPFLALRSAVDSPTLAAYPHAAS